MCDARTSEKAPIGMARERRGNEGCTGDALYVNVSSDDTELWRDKSRITGFEEAARHSGVRNAWCKLGRSQ